MFAVVTHTHSGAGDRGDIVRLRRVRYPVIVVKVNAICGQALHVCVLHYIVGKLVLKHHNKYAIKCLSIHILVSLTQSRFQPLLTSATPRRCCFWRPYVAPIFPLEGAPRPASSDLNYIWRKFRFCYLTDKMASESLEPGSYPRNKSREEGH